MVEEALPNVDPAAFSAPNSSLLRAAPSLYKPRILLLYGSLRQRSFSRFMTQEAARLLEAFGEFDDSGRMKPSPYYDRVVDVMEELMKFTLLTRDVSAYLTDRYSERKEDAEKLSERLRLSQAD
ncbi:hypothetical protein [Bradyrhizobium genosp. P]|uniref:hypothetical protein n=1 Tax=Bradyrhizobium genosp. P TaxID=83641 RepID=UPI003CF2FEED